MGTTNKLVARRPPAGQEQMQTTRPEPIDFDEKPKGKRGTPVKKPAQPDKEYKLNDDWWDTLSPNQQREYQEEHPKSKYADERVKDEQDSGDGEDEAEDVEVREPKDESKDIKKFNDYNRQTENFNVTKMPKRPQGPGLGEGQSKKGLEPGAKGTGLKKGQPVKKGPEPELKDEPRKPASLPSPKMRDKPKASDTADDWQEDNSRKTTVNRKGNNGHGMVKQRVSPKELQERIDQFSDEEQDFLENGGTEPKSKQREALGKFIVKDAKNLAGGYIRDAGSALSGLNSVRKILKGDRLEPSDWKKLGKMMFNMAGWMVATGLSGGSLGAGFLAFGALKHAIVPAVGYMFKKDWTHKPKQGKRKLDLDENSDSWFKDEDGNSIPTKKSKAKPAAKKPDPKDKEYQEFLKWKKSKGQHASLVEAADGSDEELLTLMFERLGDYMAEGTIPNSAWQQAILDHPGKDHSSKT